MKCLLLLSVLLAAVLAVAAGLDHRKPITLPIHGDFRKSYFFDVNITVGGMRPFSVIFDSGSSEVCAACGMCACVRV